MTIKVSIVGASGYTGGELLRILDKHPDVEIIGAYGKTSAGNKVSELHPQLASLMDLTVKEVNLREMGKSSDLVFTATPHGTAMNFVPDILENGAKVVDLSADYRLNVHTYEEYYQKHESPDLEAVYGLPEIYREEIKKANLVANPGCYPTSAILALAPLLKYKMIETDPIVVDSKSGSSGAGAKPSDRLHHPTCTENLRPYNVTAHRHSPEIKEEVEKLSDKDTNLCFTPHLVPMIRGILTTLHVFGKDETEGEDIFKSYREFYRDEPFIRILERLPQTNAVRGSNFCDIGLRTSQESGRIVVISAIDNLVKGASGQAIQNMNIMFGFDERKGLKDIPLRP